MPGRGQVGMRNLRKRCMHILRRRLTWSLGFEDTQRMGQSHAAPEGRKDVGQTHAVAHLEELLQAVDLPHALGCWPAASTWCTHSLMCSLPSLMCCIHFQCYVYLLGQLHMLQTGAVSDCAASLVQCECQLEFRPHVCCCKLTTKPCM